MKLLKSSSALHPSSPETASPLLPKQKTHPNQATMPPPLQQAFDAGGGNHFSFAPSIAKKSQSLDGEDATAHVRWIQRVRGSYGYLSRPIDVKPGRAWLDAEEFRGLTLSEDDHLGDDASPPLWGKARPPRLVPVFPSSQAQVLAKYRQEMVELVRGLPETAYELSLRDLVEVPRMGKPQEEEEKDAGKERGAAPEVVAGRDEKKEKKVKSGKKQILRSTSMDSGVFLLKMFFPSSLGGKRRSGVAGSGSKVSPKTVLADGEKGRAEKNMDAGWLERGERSRSEGGNSSGQRRKTVGCYPFSIPKGRIRW